MCGQNLGKMIEVDGACELPCITAHNIIRHKNGVKKVCRISSGSFLRKIACPHVVMEGDDRGSVRDSPI